MPLRSASTPILNSWLPKAVPESSSPEPDPSLPRRRRPKSLTLTRSSFSTLITSPDPPKNPPKNPPRPFSELKATTGRHPAPVPTLSRTTSLPSSLASVMAAEGGEEKVGPGSSSVDVLSLAVGGGGVCGGGGGRSGSGRGDDSGRGCDGTDAYYRKMIEDNPGNGLLLGNYAKFLKEVRGDLAKAEEYCERAILSNPNDANLLSLYADLIWETKRDADRAETYFNQAVKTDPDDCYVMASYARFLWDAEEEDEDEEESRHCGNESTMLPEFSKGASHHQPLAAASQVKTLVYPLGFAMIVNSE